MRSARTGCRWALRLSGGKEEPEEPRGPGRGLLPLVSKFRLGNALPGKLQLRLTVKDLNDFVVFEISRLLAMR